MSYMRGDYYVWHDGDNMHIWAAKGYDRWDHAVWAVDLDGNRHSDMLEASGVGIPEAVLDELAMMRLAELLEEGQAEAAIDRAVQKSGGNFGCHALAQNAEAIKAGLRQIKIETDREQL
jgi:hypothetical protein